MARSLKVRVILALGYGCGLRAGEIARLKPDDIDSAQMLIRIVQSKGRKDRYVMLAEEVLSLLRQWWIDSGCRRAAFIRTRRTARA